MLLRIVVVWSLGMLVQSMSMSGRPPFTALGIFVLLATFWTIPAVILLLVARALEMTLLRGFAGIVVAAGAFGLFTLLVGGNPRDMAPVFAVTGILWSLSYFAVAPMRRTA